MQFVNWLLGCVLIYASLFGIGELIFKEWLSGLIYLVVAIIAAVLIWRNLSTLTWQAPTEEDNDASKKVFTTTEA